MPTKVYWTWKLNFCASPPAGFSARSASIAAIFALRHSISAVSEAVGAVHAGGSPSAGFWVGEAVGTLSVRPALASAALDSRGSGVDPCASHSLGNATAQSTRTKITGNNDFFSMMKV